jgi:hypothetical protein
MKTFDQIIESITEMKYSDPGAIEYHDKRYQYHKKQAARFGKLAGSPGAWNKNVGIANVHQEAARAHRTLRDIHKKGIEM